MAANLPAHINEHRRDANWNCVWCGLPPEPWPCKKLRATARAYFRSNPTDLPRFMGYFLQQALHDPAFRDMAVDLVKARFVGWIDPALEAQRKLDAARERAAVAVSTGAQRAVRSVTRWYQNHILSALTPRGMQRAERPSMGQPAEGRR